MFDTQQLARELIDYIESEAAPSRQTISAHTNLLESEVLDPLFLMDLVAHIESTYGIRIEESELAPRHFRSVDCLTRLIVSKLNRPLTADCLLCREIDTFGELADLDAPSRLLPLPNGFAWCPSEPPDPREDRAPDAR